MTETCILTGPLYLQLIQAGTINLRAHVKTVNDLNVFPIPDGDTGDNMLLTMQGGANIQEVDDNLSSASDSIARGMLLGARGNSGVILSQFFYGIAEGLKGLITADAKAMGEAFRQGVIHAYDSVLTPTEGTILTVIKDATEYACKTATEKIEEFISSFVHEAKQSLERTPDLLAVLKKAGVVDSGGAGLIYIMEGMLRKIRGEEIADTDYEIPAAQQEAIDFSLFDEDSEMTFGYCTELLLRLQSKKTDVSSFTTAIVTDYLETIGDSIVAVKTGSIVKIHVHTMTPEKVLEFCRKYGEFLTVKIENMTLQHSNSSTPSGNDETEEKSHTKYAIVAVAAGEGVKNTFLEIGADVIVDGGQSMNPSAQDFIDAFNRANADEIFVFPNNGNIILAAQQAANIFTESKVYVIESKTIGDGYAAISMMNPDSESAELIIEDFQTAMDSVITAEVSQSVRDSQTSDGKKITNGDYIGFIDKNIYVSSPSRLDAALETVEKTGFGDHDVCIVIRGKDSTEDEAEKISQHIKSLNPFSEVYTIDGGQDIYSYILIAE